jgi:Amidase
MGSCAGMASLVLPAGFTADGLPIGMEFAGLSGTDRNVLALGLSLEKALGPSPAPNYGTLLPNGAKLGVTRRLVRSCDNLLCENGKSTFAAGSGLYIQSTIGW